MSAIPVLTPQQASDWDAATVARGGSMTALMNAAGSAVAALVVKRYAAAIQHGVLVASGSGKQ